MESARKAQHGFGSGRSIFQNHDTQLMVVHLLPTQLLALGQRKLIAEARRDRDLASLGHRRDVRSARHEYIVSCRYIM